MEGKTKKKNFQTLRPCCGSSAELSTAHASSHFILPNTLGDRHYSRATDGRNQGRERSISCPRSLSYYVVEPGSRLQLSDSKVQAFLCSKSLHSTFSFDCGILGSVGSVSHQQASCSPWSKVSGRLHIIPRDKSWVCRALSQGPACPESAGIEAFWPPSLPHGNIICSQPAIVGELPFRCNESKDHMETL